MADVQRPGARSNRPTSPHLQIYRPLINMVMSIVHRITGVALSGGALLLAVWLVAAALDRGLFETINWFLASWPGQIVMLGFVWTFLHHLLGGVRHVIWDTGAGFDLASVDRMSWGTLVLSVLGTLAIFVIAHLV